MKKYLLPIAAASMLSLPSHAYYSEFNLLTHSKNAEFAYDLKSRDYEIDTSVQMFSASIFFKNVDASKGPLAEAAFLDKAGSGTLAFYTGDSEYSNETDFNEDFDGNALAINAIINKFIIRASYNNGTNEDLYGESESDSISFGLGGYLTEKATLVISVQKSSNEYNKQVINEHSGLNADLKFHIPFGQSGKSMSVGGDFSILGSEYSDGTIDGATSAINLFATYYPMNNLGLTAALDTSVFFGEGEGQFQNQDFTLINQTLAFEARYFPIEQLSLFASLETTFGEQTIEGTVIEQTTEISGTGFSLGLSGRF